jgi:hypothetical protein
MKDPKIVFKRNDWSPETIETIPVASTKDKIWMITDEHNYYTGKLDDRKIQQQIKKELTENFSSIHFMSTTSVYFYFTDPADEALFVFTYSEKGFEICQ